MPHRGLSITGRHVDLGRSRSRRARDDPLAERARRVGGARRGGDADDQRARVGARAVAALGDRDHGAPRIFPGVPSARQGSGPPWGRPWARPRCHERGGLEDGPAGLHCQPGRAPGLAAADDLGRRVLPGRAARRARPRRAQRAARQPRAGASRRQPAQIVAAHPDPAGGRHDGGVCGGRHRSPAARAVHALGCCAHQQRVAARSAMAQRAKALACRPRRRLHRRDGREPLAGRGRGARWRARRPQHAAAAAAAVRRAPQAALRDCAALALVAAACHPRQPPRHRSGGCPRRRTLHAARGRRPHDGAAPARARGGSLALRRRLR